MNGCEILNAHSVRASGSEARHHRLRRPVSISGPSPKSRPSSLRPGVTPASCRCTTANQTTGASFWRRRRKVTATTRSSTTATLLLDSAASGPKGEWPGSPPAVTTCWIWEEAFDRILSVRALALREWRRSSPTRKTASHPRASELRLRLSTGDQSFCAGGPDFAPRLPSGDRRARVHKARACRSTHGLVVPTQPDDWPCVARA